jgi:hypothetical protein
MVRFSLFLEKLRRTGDRSWVRTFGFSFPFSFPGTVLFLVSLALIVRSTRSGNPYGFVFSGFAIAALFFLSIFGRLQAARFSGIHLQWDSSAPLIAGSAQNTQRIHTRDITTLPFYRLHFRIRGKAAVGRNAFFHVYQETSGVGGETLCIPLRVPFCGGLSVRGCAAVRDIFGLTRARFGPDSIRTMVIRPGPHPEVKSRHINAVGGQENRSRQAVAEEERYYMREYMPGDRFRDINWKSSSRLAQLITRISPHTQEKKKLVCVDFRHYRPSRAETLDSIALLDQSKSWLVGFLRRMKRDNPEYEFLVSTGAGVFRLNREEDIDAFTLEVSGMFFQPEPPGFHPFPGAQEIFVFTTVCDDQLARALSGYGRASVTVFRSTVAEKGEKKGRQVRLFPSAGSSPIPGPWVFRKERLAAQGGTGLASGGRIEDHPVGVRFFG